MIITSVSAGKEQPTFELLVFVLCYTSNETSRWHIQNEMKYLNHGVHCPGTLWFLKNYISSKAAGLHHRRKKKNPAKVSKQNFWLTKSLNHKATRDKDSALGKCLFASSGNGWRNSQETGHQAEQPSAPSWHGCFCCDGRAGLCNSSDVFSKGWIYVYKLYS